MKLRLKKSITKKINFQTRKNYFLKFTLACSPTLERFKNVYMFLKKSIVIKIWAWPKADDQNQKNILSTNFDICSYPATQKQAGKFC